jgi:ubiquinone/menaquinone biosynthesis C-methylase UbiE
MSTHDPYANLADLYDSFAADDSFQVFYREWRDSLLAAVQKYNISVRILIDLACGTGNSTISWTKQPGWKVIGVDRSAAMLRMARKKSRHVQWYRQDLTKLNLKERADVITCHFDALNHILTRKALQQVFFKIAQTMNEGGLFQFDLNTEGWLRWLKAHEKLFWVGQNCFMAYNEYDPKQRIATFHQLWFIHKKRKLYEKRIVTVQETAFSTSEIRQMLKKAGMQLLKQEIQRKMEGIPIRILYLARRRSSHPDAPRHSILFEREPS